MKKDIFKTKTDIILCIEQKLQSIKDKYSHLLEGCKVDFDKATCITSDDNNYWGFYPDPDNPFEELPSIVQSEAATAIKDCVDAHSNNI